MPFYKVTIYKHLIMDPTEKWSNVYTVDSDGEDGALDIGNDIMALETAVHKDYVVFDKITARQDNPLAGSGRQRAVSGVVGEVTGTPSLRLPLFNAVRCIFSDLTGRPDQKYLRLPIEEGDQSGGFLEEAFKTDIDLNYTTPLVALTGVVSSDHDPYTGSFIQDAIQMRQLSWSRRTRPGFKRGWVPV